MNIRSIDLQVLVPRTTEVAKVQAVNDHQSVVNQQEFAQRMQADANQRQQQVQSSPRNEGGKIRRDKGDGSSGHPNQSEQHAGNHHEDGDEPAVPEDSVRGHVVDIKT